MPETCAFCAIVGGDVPAEEVASWHDAIAIVPLNPVSEGHVIVLSRAHVPDALAHPWIAGQTLQRAAEYAIGRGPCNLITSVGAAATQSVWHLHVHVVPRKPHDGLLLPWVATRSTSDGTWRTPTPSTTGWGKEVLMRDALGRAWQCCCRLLREYRAVLTEPDNVDPMEDYCHDWP